EGGLKLYHSAAAFGGTAPGRGLRAKSDRAFGGLEGDAALALEPALAPAFRRAVYWSGPASVTNPLAVTRAYAARLAALGGIVINADARSLRRAGTNWRIDGPGGTLAAGDGGRRPGPWAADRLWPLRA